MSTVIPGIGAITSVFGPVAGPVAGPIAPGASGSGDSGFTGVLKSALDGVNGLQNDAAQQVNTMMSGGSADLGHVMISVEKADVAFQLMMQVRNKIVSAYQDIEKMQF